MPPKGWSKKAQEDELLQKRMHHEKELKEKPSMIEVVKEKPQAPALKTVKDDREYAKVLISFRDKKGHPVSVSYTMAELRMSENIEYQFKGASRITHISINIDGTVIEKY